MFLTSERENMSQYERILRACTKPTADSAISAVVDLIPDAGFSMNRVMPPIYIDGDKKKMHHIEHRADENGKPVKIVILDSIQSTANRAELAALFAMQTNDLRMADITFKVKALNNRDISILQLSHRIFDATLRDTEIEGKTFVESDIGKKIYGSDLLVAMREVCRWSPASILLGGWCSHVNNTRAFKFPRLFQSEVIAGLVSETERTSSKVDPLQIEDVVDIYCKNGEFGKPWSLKEDDLVSSNNGKSKKDKGKVEKKKASEIGHGPIPPSKVSGGVSVSWIQDRFNLSLHRTFRYNTGTPKEDQCVRAYLICLGLYMFLLKSQTYDLRSGCGLRRKSPDTVFNYETYETLDPFRLNLEEAKELYEESLKSLPKDFIHKTPLVVETTAKLEELIRMSGIFTE